MVIIDNFEKPSTCEKCKFLDSGCSCKINLGIIDRSTWTNQFGCPMIGMVGNPTNGDIIMLTCPDAKITEYKSINIIKVEYTNGFEADYLLNWWNSPCKIFNYKNKEEISLKDNTINQFLNSPVEINIDSFNTSIFDYSIKISTREYNCLVRANKTTIWQLFLSTDYEMLNNIRNFGVQSFDHINNALKLLFGFEFADINNLDGYKNRLSLMKQFGFIHCTKEIELLNKFNYDHNKSVMFKSITVKKPIIKYSGGDFDGDVL